MQSGASTLLFMTLMAFSCSQSDKPASAEHPVGSFGYDQSFLQTYDPDITLLTSENGLAQVLVSAHYQGKVFTSTAGGPAGRSFGWVNYDAFSAPEDSHMNAFGGENRLWLGPEGAQYSVFFAPGVSMTFDNWHTPAGFDTEPWEVVSKNGSAIAMKKAMELTNYAGTRLNIRIDRKVRLLPDEEIASLLNVSVDSTVRWVGYATDNALINTGQQEWTRTTGAPCLWMLDMFVPSPNVTIVIPYKEKASGKVATTDYFGAIPADRVRHEGGILYFKADGKSRGKLGIPPQRASRLAGSYDSDNAVLTLTFFDVDEKATYLNQEWKLVPDPYAGDAVNAYNDGPLEDGSQMGPFYELESVSPAAFLKPGERLQHRHTVIHVTGNRDKLDTISRETLGVSLEEIQTALDN